MLVRVVRLRNVSEVSHRVSDFQLAGGGIEVGPGEEVTIQAEVYHRIRRKCHRWLEEINASAERANPEKVKTRSKRSSSMQD